MQANPERIYRQARNEVVHAFSTHEKAAQFFDPPPPVPLEAGIARMAAWVRRVGARRTKEFAEIEIPTGLPDGW